MVPWNHPVNISLSGAPGPSPAPHSAAFLAQQGGAGTLAFAASMTLLKFEGNPLLNATWTIASGCSPGDTLAIAMPLPPNYPIQALAYVPFSSTNASNSSSSSSSSTSTSSSFSAPCTLTLLSTAPLASTLEAWQAVLRSSAYSNALPYPAYGNRTVRLDVWDSSALDALGRPLLRGPQASSAAMTITFSPYNNPPTLALLAVSDSGVAAAAVGGGGSSLPWSVQGGPAALLARVVAGDPEGALASASIAVATGCAGGDSLSLSPQGAALAAAAGLAVTTQPCALLLNGSSSPAAYTAVLRAAQFASAAPNPKAASRAFAVCTVDAPPAGARNGPQPATACLAPLLTLNATAANEAPVVAALPAGALYFTEQGSALQAANYSTAVWAGDYDAADTAPGVALNWTLACTLPLSPPSPAVAAATPPCSAIFTLLPPPPGTAPTLTSAPPASLLPPLPALPYTLAVRSGVALSSIPTKAFLLSLTATEAPGVRGAGGALSSAPAGPVLVYVTRPNSPVQWPSPASSASLAENSPPGTAVGQLLAAADSDAIQSLSYSIVGCTDAFGWGGCSAYFDIQPSAPVAVADPFFVPSAASSSSTPRTFYPSRTATLVTALDGFDYESPRLRAFTLSIAATDDGQQHDPALPPSPPTTALLTLTLTLTDQPDAPVLQRVSGGGLGGLAVEGGDTLTLTGRFLGLPDAPATAQLSLATVSTGAGGLAMANTTACVLLQRLAAAECLGVPGLGAGLSFRLGVSGEATPGSATVWQYSQWLSTGLRYQPPSLAAVQRLPAAALPALLPQAVFNGSSAAAAATAAASAWAAGITALSQGTDASCPVSAAAGSLACTPGATLFLLTGSAFPPLGTVSGSSGGSSASSSSSSAPPLLAASYGPTGTEYANLSCAVTGNYTALLCAAAPGAGALLPWRVCAAGQCSGTAALSYAPPALAACAAATAEQSGLLATEGGESLRFTGLNLGPATPPGNVSGSSAALGYVVSAESAAAAAALGRAGSPLRALACAVTTADTGISCTSPPGWGTDIPWAVGVGGQLSGPSPFTLSYSPPLITNASLFLGAAAGSASSTVTTITPTFTPPTPTTPLSPFSTASIYWPDAAPSPAFASTAWSRAGGTPPRATLSLPVPQLILSTSGGELLNLTGQNFGPGIATLYFAGTRLPPGSLAYTGHRGVLAPSLPGVGAGKQLVLATGSGSSSSSGGSSYATYPFSYAPPQLHSILVLSGEGGVGVPLLLQALGANFGACCLCSTLPPAAWPACSNFTAATDCSAASCSTPALPASSSALWRAATGRAPGAADRFLTFSLPSQAAEVDVLASGNPLYGGGIPLLFINDTCLLFTTAVQLGNLSLTAGGQRSEPLPFDLLKATSQRPTLLTSDAPAAGYPTLGALATLTGLNLQGMGVVYLDVPPPATSLSQRPIGALACPPVFATIKTSDSAAVGLEAGSARAPPPSAWYGYSSSNLDIGLYWDALSNCTYSHSPPAQAPPAHTPAACANSTRLLPGNPPACPPTACIHPTAIRVGGLQGYGRDGPSHLLTAAFPPASGVAVPGAAWVRQAPPPCPGCCPGPCSSCSLPLPPLPRHLLLQAGHHQLQHARRCDLHAAPRAGLPHSLCGH